MSAKGQEGSLLLRGRLARRMSWGSRRSHGRAVTTGTPPCFPLADGAVRNATAPSPDSASCWPCTRISPSSLHLISSSVKWGWGELSGYPVPSILIHTFNICKIKVGYSWWPLIINWQILFSRWHAKQRCIFQGLASGEWVANSGKMWSYLWSLPTQTC